MIVAVFFYSAQQLEQQARYQSQQELHLSLAANLARDNPLLQQGVYDHSALKNLFHTLMVLGPAFEFYFVDPNGKLLTHSIAPSLIKRDVIDIQPIINLTQNKTPLPIYGNDPQHISREKVFSAAPVFNGIKLQGYLYVIVAGEHYESIVAQQNQKAKLTLVMLIAAIVFLFVVMLGLFYYFTRPLRLLIRDINALKKANFDTEQVSLAPWMDNSHNEVHQLGKVFEQMVEQINRQLSHLKVADIQRRELLADISHDLRTPLASLQGYLETVTLNFGKLGEKEQQQYLNTALNNAQQLNGLIDQIFELAHLDGGQVSISLETFNLAELLYDVLAKFALKAESSRVEIVVEANCENIIIYSDIAKVERVLSNLIENAIRHSPPDGKIILGGQVTEEQLCKISVQDNGTGIKQEELPYIFDPRYRASNAVNSEKKHTGLGLAITKKLMNILSGDIRVVSELGKGTEFSFTVRIPSDLSS